MTDVGDKPTEAEAKDWRALSSWFLRRDAAPGEEVHLENLDNQVRLAAKKWVCMVDNQLAKASGKELKFWVRPPEGADIAHANLDEFRAPAPTLSIGMDQGSDGWSASWFLMYERALRINVIVDQAHRTPNDCELAVVECGWWPVVLMSMIAFNINWGPWSSCRWGEECRTALSEMRQFVDKNGEFFHWLAKGLADDLGETLEHSDDYSALWDALPRMRTFRFRGERTRLGAWFGWFKAADDYDHGWTARAGVYAFVGLTKGWLVKKGRALDISAFSDAAKPKPEAQFQ